MSDSKTPTDVELDVSCSADDDKMMSLTQATSTSSTPMERLDRAIFPLLILWDALLFGLLAAFALVFGIGCDDDPGALSGSCDDLGAVGGVAPVVVFILVAWLISPLLCVPLCSCVWRRRQKFHYDIRKLGKIPLKRGIGSLNREEQALVPFVYRSEYNITLCGVENIHPFDSKKYKKVFESLGLSSAFEPNMLNFSDLASLHSPVYLTSLFYSLALVKVFEVPLCFLPAWLLQWRVLVPMASATNGSMAAARLSLEKGWSINLGAGFHHASHSKGHGFCALADISLMVRYVKSVWPTHQFQKSGVKRDSYDPRILIIDLDAHQGDGYALDAIKYEWTNVFIFDYYTRHIFPGDHVAERRIDEEGHFEAADQGTAFIRHLRRLLPRVFQQFRPDFVIYNAGTDLLEGDPLSGLSISPQSIIQRDLSVFAACMEPNEGNESLRTIFDGCGGTSVPITMVLSGGYQKTNAGVIAECIQNLRHSFSLY
eukprot:gb/GECG01006854.1/.p1 GENE.gb/GECG01006854.1/~~gb/GECG01006854.1/.p1  ORF type:complete len:485 (+),score=35.66 gb/GECG01006854.1/:1-1455(+)